jgi:hypothetical protein
MTGVKCLPIPAGWMSIGFSRCPNACTLYPCSSVSFTWHMQIDSTKSKINQTRSKIKNMPLTDSKKKLLVPLNFELYW